MGLNMKKHAIFLGLLAVFYALLCVSFLIIMLCYAANGFRSITEMHQGKTELVMGKMCTQSQCEPAVLLNTNGAFNEDIKDQVRHLINNAPTHPRWLCLNSAGGNPMTCTFEYALTLYFMVTAPLLAGDNFTVQAFSDATPYSLSPDTAELNVRVRWQRNRWLFDFKPDWG